MFYFILLFPVSFSFMLSILFYLNLIISFFSSIIQMNKVLEMFLPSGCTCSVGGGNDWLMWFWIWPVWSLKARDPTFLPPHVSAYVDCSGWYVFPDVSLLSASEGAATFLLVSADSNVTVINTTLMHSPCALPSPCTARLLVSFDHFSIKISFISLLMESLPFSPLCDRYWIKYSHKSACQRFNIYKSWQKSSSSHVKLTFPLFSVFSMTWSVGFKEVFQAALLLLFSDSLAKTIVYLQLFLNVSGRQYLLFEKLIITNGQLEKSGLVQGARRGGAHAIIGTGLDTDIHQCFQFEFVSAGRNL